VKPGGRDVVERDGFDSRRGRPYGQPSGGRRGNHRKQYKGGFFNVKGVSIPVAVTVFPGEQYQAPRSWAEQAYPNLIYFNEVDRGGHFAAWEQPQLFTEEIRAAFNSLR
jgi:pimeloyl-ACP methyl ester carboxylesterase